MAKIISISTKKGDDGTSYLANGEALPKNDLVFEVLGNIDELNSHIGMVVSQVKITVMDDKEFIIKTLESIQSNLYLLSSIIAQAPKIKFSKSKLTEIEKIGDLLQEKMIDGWTNKFLFPGGSNIGAYLDISRSVCRRCERVIVSYSSNKKTKPIILKYINRLSDFLFILRCYVNLKFGITEKKFLK